MQSLQKFDTRILLDLKYHFFQPHEASPLRIMFIASIPRKVLLAVLNEPNPIPGFVSRLINR